MCPKRDKMSRKETSLKRQKGGKTNEETKLQRFKIGVLT